MEYESELYDIKITHTALIESLMLGKIYDNLSVCQKLVSSSLFIELDNTENSGIADEFYIAKATKDLTDELKELFNDNNMLVNRAIMANTINKMPVFFHDTNEVSEYIMNSLQQCGDKAEKASCISIIRQLIE